MQGLENFNKINFLGLFYSVSFFGQIGFTKEKRQTLEATSRRPDVVEKYNRPIDQGNNVLIVL